MSPRNAGRNGQDPAAVQTSISTPNQVANASTAQAVDSETWRQCTGQPSPNCPIYVSEPTGTHRQSIIILHGRGDTGPSFGMCLMDDTDFDSVNACPRRALPDARFIFPTAAPLPSARFKGWKLNQWFDFWSLFDVQEQAELQNAGLHDNTRVVEALIEQEAAVVGMENVIIGGISNGAAQAIITALLMIASGKLRSGNSLGGVFGVCGWLPHAQDIMKKATSEGNGTEGDVTLPDHEGEPEAALTWLSTLIRGGEEDPIEMHPEPDVCPRLPIFLGHGEEDNTVPPERFWEAGAALQSLGIGVEMKMYTGLGHWYSDKMMIDLVQWIKNTRTHDL